MRVTDVEPVVVAADRRNRFSVQVTTDDGSTGVGETLSGEGIGQSHRGSRPGSSRQPIEQFSTGQG